MKQISNVMRKLDRVPVTPGMRALADAVGENLRDLLAVAQQPTPAAQAAKRKRKAP
jgi:hypothetical protein